ncbi:MAG: hypothetical protein M1822_008908 [Bathelium mastoideum]|nr:MAG: hypothetical protein M1822_008908 [Bathelium mastoideum]
MDNSRMSRESGVRTPSIHDNPDVFSDDYAVDHFDRVADGFRPLLNQETEQQLPPQQQQTVPSVRRSISIGNPIESKNAPPTSVSRNSTTKGYGSLDPQRFSREVARGVPLQNRTESLRSSNSATPAIRQHRSGSSASSSTLMGNVRSQSPFQGASGPSHPYALYPQGVGVDRSSSIGTASTLRAPQRSESSATRPAHPYAMYSQNVFADPGDDDVSPVDESIPVGFPGHANNDRFHRRLGPEGEEQDIIGPDGHTEQLPPYSRFPDNMDSKGLPVADDPSSIVPQGSGIVSQQVDSTETLMPTTDDHNATTSQVNIPSARTSRTVEQMESGTAEKSWNEKSWREKQQTRFCAGKFPLWVLLLAAALVLFLAAIIGGLVGGFLAQNRAAAEAAQSSISSLQNSQMLSDASPISTPPNLPQLPTGTFAVPVGIPQETQSSCLVNPAQVKAWSCQIPMEPHMAPVNVVVDPPAAMGGPPLAQVINPDLGQPIQYGAQPPNFGPSPLQLVIDQEAPGLGPAFYFSATYNKTVILDPSTFEPTTNAKRQEPSFGGNEDYGHFGNSWPKRNEVSPGDQPWVCFWNDTFVELFIYDTRNTSASASSSLSIMVSASSDTLATSASSSASSTSTAPPTTSMTDTTSIPMTSSTVVSITPTLSSTTSSIATTSSPVEASTTDSSSFSWLSNASPINSWSTTPPFDMSPPPERRDYSSSSSSSYNNNGNNGNDNGNEDNSSNNNNGNGGNNGNGNSNFPQGPTAIYPRPVKVAEHQLPGIAPAPSCILMQVLEDHTLNPAPNPNGSDQPVVVQLLEPSPSYPSSPQTSGGNMLSKRGEKAGLRKRDPENACHCVWLSE